MSNQIINSILPKEVKVYVNPDQGLTSSEANHISNMIKEHIKTTNAEIHGVRAYNEDLTLDGKDYVIARSKKPTVAQFLQPGKFYAASAWLRSAVKAKEEGLNLLEFADAKEFDLNLNEPSFNLEMPASLIDNKPQLLDEDSDADQILDVKELCEYLSLEAQAAHLGKAIHDQSNLSNVREEILNKGQELTRFDEKRNGDVHIISMTASYKVGEINDLYFELQAEHRRVESKLNWFKAKIKNAVADHNVKITDEYTTAYNELHTKYEAELAEYNAEADKYRRLLNSWSHEMRSLRTQSKKLFSSYKITVPNDLSTVIEEVKTLFQK